MKYCHDCDWTAGADEFGEGDQSQRALKHFLETGHAIDSAESTTRPRSPPAPGKILRRDLLS